ncbi:transcriptional regulator [Halobiforma lacisalsi AJ5]|uniref:Putative transcription regulator n=1 Tax=Natronobacterium lacisalsi AJ5 TaxID=358396 RepID=M0LGC4_NATLA|nr:metalloregulator ArsR/SmtB family transcription factor [Halobiforma lacisalsi]APW98715.1 transcriptional regulator [Halobiforma lacisalsi AJ5]EMA32586.1 putative transcription regulator [Halobiforma lacisalsi AJ5]
MGVEEAKRDECGFTLREEDVDRLLNRSVIDRVELFSTLGNETRYRILLVLTEASDPVCGCELEPYFDVGQSSISQALTRLHRAGLVTRTKDGRWRYYEPTATGERLVGLVEDGLDGEPLIAD